MVDETDLRSCVKRERSLNAIVNGRFRSESSRQARYYRAIHRVCKYSRCHPQMDNFTAQTTRGFLALTIRDSSTRSLHVPSRVFLEWIQCKCPRETARHSPIFIYANKCAPSLETDVYVRGGMFLKSAFSHQRRRGRDAFKLTFVAGVCHRAA